MNHLSQVEVYPHETREPQVKTDNLFAHFKMFNIHYYLVMFYFSTQ